MKNRIKSLAHAGRGLGLLLKSTPNVWLQLAALIIVILLGRYFNISTIEWILIVLAAGFVFTAEAFNTAIEVDINLTSPDFHPYARDTKDLSAAAVLISAITALIVGLIIFVPRFSNL